MDGRMERLRSCAPQVIFEKERGEGGTGVI